MNSETSHSGIMINPDCRDGKHTSCNGNGFDPDKGVFAQCPCPCHRTPR